MIKKILTFTLVLVFLFSCGKKGDPEYKSKKNIFEFNKVHKYLKS